MSNEKKSYIIHGWNHSTDFGKEEVFTTLRGAKQKATQDFQHLDAEVVIYEKFEGDPVDELIPVCSRRWGMVYPGPTHAWVL